MGATFSRFLSCATSRVSKLALILREEHIFALDLIFRCNPYEHSICICITYCSGYVNNSCLLNLLS